MTVSGFPPLIEKTEKNGIEVDVAIGDGAYAERDNLEMAKESSW